MNQIKILQQIIKQQNCFSVLCCNCPGMYHSECKFSWSDSDLLVLNAKLMLRELKLNELKELNEKDINY